VVPSRLRDRVSDAFRVPPDRLAIIAGVDDCLRRIAATTQGPLVVFPPSASSRLFTSFEPRHVTLVVNRGAGHHCAIDATIAADLPPDAVAYIDSPSDPLGSLVAAADLARLAKSCRMVVIDERFAQFAGRSLLPIALEFNNVIVLRSFDPWHAYARLPGGWALTPPRPLVDLGLRDSELERRWLEAALTLLDQRDLANGTLTQIRSERARLYRFVRKLILLEPIPSWGPFLAARVRLVSRDHLMTELRSHGILVHAPVDTGLERMIRVSIATPWMTDRFIQAMTDLSPQLIATSPAPISRPF
jgi:histidinol-phosphate aminotransferase